jgi:uncharacterized protein GlcG (DUF336 family)
MKAVSFALACFSISAFGQGTNLQDKCLQLPTVEQLKQYLTGAPGINDGVIGGTVGGLFGGTRMWGAIVNRDGEVCVVAASRTDAAQVWPGSQAIAKAKAYTANAFSIDTLALSTARLYTFTQPGHSLWSLGQSNLFDPQQLAGVNDSEKSKGKIAGGTIFFGGGVPLYAGGRVVGGLGISGDTSCADHEIAKRVRQLAGMNPPGGAVVDDIVYTSLDGASVFAHPKCINTWRNGTRVGEETPVTQY